MRSRSFACKQKKVKFYRKLINIALLVIVQYHSEAKVTFTILSMTHFVTDRCIRCKYTDCVEVCPVDCFYEGSNMLVIDPDQCIDCGVCVPECPVDAIVNDEFMEEVLSNSESNLNEEQKKLKRFYGINAEFSKKWANITSSKPPLEEADAYKDSLDKEELFEENL